MQQWPLEFRARGTLLTRSHATTVTEFIIGVVCIASDESAYLRAWLNRWQAARFEFDFILPPSLPWQCQLAASVIAQIVVKYFAMLFCTRHSRRIAALPSCSVAAKHATAPGHLIIRRRADTRAIPPGIDKLDASEGIPRLQIKKGKANLFLEGNPIVYRGAIEKVHGEPHDGAPVVVTDWKDCAIAWGVYNGTSMFACRVLQLDREVRADPSVALDVPGVLKKAIEQAASLRTRLGLPCADTDIYRLINSEGDGISGTVLSPCLSWPARRRLVPLHDL
eukprot:jgi/Ulvmu1/8978/UM005_0069.1